jgi:hypothetical protein
MRAVYEQTGRQILIERWNRVKRGGRQNAYAAFPSKKALDGGDIHMISL